MRAMTWLSNLLPYWACCNKSCEGVSQLQQPICANAGEECYMACDKGAINPQHVLILPVEHQRSSAAVSVSTYAEMERYLSALRSCFASQVFCSLLSTCHAWVCM